VQVNRYGPIDPVQRAITRITPQWPQGIIEQTAASADHEVDGMLHQPTQAGLRRVVVQPLARALCVEYRAEVMQESKIGTLVGLEHVGQHQTRRGPPASAQFHCPLQHIASGIRAVAGAVSHTQFEQHIRVVAVGFERARQQLDRFAGSALRQRGVGQEPQCFRKRRVFGQNAPIDLFGVVQSPLLDVLACGGEFHRHARHGGSCGHGRKPLEAGRNGHE
jgi:hypothetical protein